MGLAQVLRHGQRAATICAPMRLAASWKTTTPFAAHARPRVGLSTERSLRQESEGSSRFRRDVLLLRKGEDSIIRVAVSDEDIMQLSGDSTVHVRDLGLLHASAHEKRQRLDIIVRYVHASSELDYKRTIICVDLDLVMQYSYGHTLTQKSQLESICAHVPVAHTQGTFAADTASACKCFTAERSSHPF